jgi:thioredoxin reductase (NADPH)
VAAQPCHGDPVAVVGGGNSAGRAAIFLTGHATRVSLLVRGDHPGVFAVGDVRSGSIKRVTSAVGEGPMAVRLIHEYLEAGPPS